jgi:hypothetical protein
LYIVVHDIGAHSLASSECQLCLAKLAECPSVCLVATMEHLNTPTLWAADQLARFRWNLERVDTFAPQPVSQNFPCVVRETEFGASSTDGAAALEYLLTSLSSRHHELLSVVCKYIQEVNNEDATSSSATSRAAAAAVSSSSSSSSSARPSHLLKSIPFDVLLERCTKKLIAQKPDDVKALLKEFIDHKIISIAEAMKAENVVLHVPFERIQSLAASL